MRKLRVYESISVDGYFCDAQGDMSWAHASPDDGEFSSWVAENAASGGDLLFGRKTYQMMESFWPTAQAFRAMPEVASGMRDANKYVVSRSLSPTWENTRVLGGELTSAVRNLKAVAGPDITVLGSGSVVEALGEAGLVDEFQFVIVPIVLGAGRRLLSSRCKLRLVEHRAFVTSGHLMLLYEA
jgi:dihydrofolate reductase